ncbi:isopentenyl-diphosphate Delta-isomerase [Parafilimonas sp.]|uniref:isopentenyl-diphosphate Delta-isomerase n=1 Tax=Parafilimonas sp. TaxID=1969739 RepID=UPI0039E6A4FA
MVTMEEVILVNEQDEETGVMEKMEAHLKGRLHRAFSIFIFNDKNEMLLQQRAAGKYHSAGLWTNACCSHPRPGEKTQDAAARRLKEELGFETQLGEIFEFSYKASFENGLTEHEFDHVFAGTYNGNMHLNKTEVQEVCFRSMEEIESDLQTHSHKFTAWFLLAFPLIKKWMNTTAAVA